MTAATAVSKEEFHQTVVAWLVMSKTADELMSHTFYVDGKRTDMVFVKEFPFTYRQFCIFVLRSTHKETSRLNSATVRAAECEWRALMDVCGLEAPDLPSMFVRLVAHLKHAQKRMGGDSTADALDIPLSALVADIEKGLEA